MNQYLWGITVDIPIIDIDPGTLNLKHGLRWPLYANIINVFRYQAETKLKLLWKKVTLCKISEYPPNIFKKHNGYKAAKNI